ncbi:uncharacterized protein LOC135435466 [Drosophila montana]|uniref:uncharacterized protein LOC135435466 n=1 Tax=Drosophila montana TaxID=40370 RepID=UPI00313ACB1B
MIENLNDDCQLLIVNYLELRDQLALWEATEDIAPRLNSNVSYAWQHKLSYVLKKHTLDEFEEHPKHLEAFLSAISPSVQQLDLQYITLRQLKLWVGHRFPRTRVLAYTLDEYDELTNAERALELLVVLFPELNSVKPFGPFKGRIIAKWTQLRQLDLSESWPIDESVSMCKFQKLEQLTIDCDFINNISTESILCLPKLRTLCFHPGDKSNEVLGQIIQHRGLDIHELIFHDIIWDCALATLQQVKNLRQLTLIEDDGFKVAQLQSLVSALPLLEQLNLINFQFWRTETELWQTVANCSSLRILNISGMQLYSEFFDFSRRPMEDVLRKRPEPLTLNCHNTGDNEHLIRQRFAHSNLILSFEQLNVDYIDNGYVKIRLVPLVPSNS